MTRRQQDFSSQRGGQLSSEHSKTDFGFTLCFQKMKGNLESNLVAWCLHVGLSSCRAGQPATAGREQEPHNGSAGTYSCLLHFPHSGSSIIPNQHQISPKSSRNPNGCFLPSLPQSSNNTWRNAGRFCEERHL